MAQMVEPLPVKAPVLPKTKKTKKTNKQKKKTTKPSLTHKLLTEQKLKICHFGPVALGAPILFFMAS
jgi:hypothetical protein